MAYCSIPFVARIFKAIKSIFLTKIMKNVIAVQQCKVLANSIFSVVHGLCINSIERYLKMTKLSDCFECVHVYDR